MASGIDVLDTRKTTPGWRSLEKYAVITGGGKSHRSDLNQMALVKNNHIDANGGDIRKTLEQLYRDKPPYLAVQVEVRDEKELSAALEFNPNSIMLDNFNDRGIGKVLKIWRERENRGEKLPLLEISGNVTKERLSKLKSLGAARISTSALVAAARNLDFSLRINFASDRRKSGGR
jgi:nicotinate-nucleotide pyrophosphorylase (carboxylating)